ncbi:MAG TPA: hypothetical protein VFQ44_02265 [Streptosporangiaceae bacterium]|nr:hypothetical protein [Streptosporangiaceae bacterium]
MIDEDEYDYEAAELAWAWDMWRTEVCEEATSGHRWVLECPPGEYAKLHCILCPATADFVIPYGGETLRARFSHRGFRIEVDDSEHNWPGPGTLVIPVFPHSYAETYRGFDYTEYESWIELEPR